MSKNLAATLGVQADALARKLDALKAKQRKLDAEKAALDAESEALLKAMLEAKVELVAGKKGKASVSRIDLPQVDDWAAFEAWALKARDLTLYQRRLSSTAWRERIEAGEVVPGVKKFTSIKLNVKGM